MYVYMNGHIVKKDKVRISPFDHGFLYGLGLFETLRVYAGHPFLLHDHIERLNNGLALLNIKQRFSVSEWKEKINKLLVANAYTDAYLRLNVSAGTGEIGLSAEPYEHPTVIIFSRPLPKEEVFPEKEATILQIKRNTPEAAVRLKSHHFLNNVLAKQEIGSDVNREGIFLTEKGFLAEGIVSNLFWVKDGIVYTPSLETGILNGITRQFIITLLREKGIRVQIGLYEREHLLQADEAFMTNSIQEIVPFRSVETTYFPGNNGEITQKLTQQYKKYREKLLSHSQLTLGVE